MDTVSLGYPVLVPIDSPVHLPGSSCFAWYVCGAPWVLPWLACLLPFVGLGQIPIVWLWDSALTCPPLLHLILPESFLALPSDGIAGIEVCTATYSSR